MGTHQLLVCADVHILGENINTVKKAEVLLQGSKEVGLEVNAEKTKTIISSIECRIKA
jgi:hypothetical protein